MWITKFGIGAGAAALVLGLLGSQASAQQDDWARDPVRATDRELVRECGRDARLRRDSIIRGDFTGDEAEDLIIIVDTPCRGLNSFFCGTAGCRTDVWVNEGGGYRRTNDLITHGAEIFWSRGRPAVRFSGGPVWVWNGRALEIASHGGGYVEAPSAPPAPPAPEPVSPRFGQWSTEPAGRSGVRAFVANRDGGYLALGCRRGDDVMRLSILPETGAPGGPGDQFLIDFVVDLRVVDTRLMKISREGDRLTDIVTFNSKLVRALKGGSTLRLRVGGEDSGVAPFRLRGSSSAISRAARECRR